MFRLALHWQILIAVIVAAAGGLMLSGFAGEAERTVRLADGRSVQIHDTVNKITIRIFDPDDKLIKTRIVDPTGQIEGSFTTLSLLAKKDAEEDDETHALFVQHGRSTARWIGDWSDRIGQLFLRLLRMVAIPLIITSLMSGVLGLADAGRLRRMFGMTVTYYVCTSVLAICTGLLLVNLIQPGHRGPEAGAARADLPPPPDLGETLFSQLEKMIPPNPIQAVATSDFLPVIAFTLIFGVFTILVGGKPLQVFRDLFESGFKVMMALTLAIIHLAPIGVFFLMLAVTSTQGAEVFQALGFYMITVFLALAIHATLVLPLIVYLVARRNPWKFAHAMSPALMTAFSSASSNATLPLTLTCVEERAGIDNRIGSFVLPLGATINMDGTALFEVIAVLFIAQMEPGVSLTLGQQVLVALTALLASIGAAGIPHAGLVMMVIVLQAVGLPTDKVALILAVDRILDMCRTAVNVWSDSCGCAVIARFESGEPLAVVPPAPESLPAPDTAIAPREVVPK